LNVLIVPSPVGALLLREDAGKLAEVAFVSPTFSPETPFEQELAASNLNAQPFTAARLNAVAVLTPEALDSPETPPILRRAAAQLAEYFAGTRTRFDLPLAPVGTDFQRRVWDATAAIPFGETATYGEIARKIGVPNGSRAVGGALNRNPLAIVVPCHRVVGSFGKLTGYDGGVDRKAFLLNLERPEPPRLF
jgi:methylated-DNA-[protein]-cysteine S-methyltransferase